MKLKALKPLRYGGAPVRPGETFPATRGHARVLQALGRAEVAAETPLPEPGKPRRSYRRRDIEPAQAVVMTAQAAESAAAPLWPSED